MSEASTKDCKNAFGEEMKKQMESMPFPDYKCRVIQDGEIIDLGGRKIKCIAIGAHHPRLHGLPRLQRAPAVHRR